MVLDAFNTVHNEIIRLKAIGSSLVALARAEMEVDPCQLEELGKMVTELAVKIQE